MDAETKALLKRVAAARSFPNNTTPASRHLELIADALVKGEPYPMLTEDPEHCGVSILCVVAEMYETKTLLAKLSDETVNPA